MPSQEIPLIIDLTEFTADLLIPQTTDTAKVEAIIRKAQQLDLRLVMGDAFYYHMLKNITDSMYVTLIDGCEYTDDDGNLIIFSGLRMAVKSWSWARYIMTVQKVVTRYGYNVKQDDFSTPVDGKTIALDAASERSAAVEYWNEAHKFLTTTANKLIYTLYEPNCITNNNARGSIKIWGTGKF